MTVQFDSDVRYRDSVTQADPKRWAWFAGGLWVFAMPFIAMAIYFLNDGALWTVFILPVHTFVLIPLIDFLVGEDLTNVDAGDVNRLAADPFYMRIAHILVVSGHISVIGGIGFIATQSLPIWAIAVLTFGLGVASASLINLAHELGHKTRPIDQLMARLSLAGVGYGHFCISHNQGHHIHVSTPEDSASSRMGENVYQFALREIPAAITGAWRIEARRLRRKGMAVWSCHNRILMTHAVTLSIMAVLTALWGWVVLPIMVVHHFVAWSVLTCVNYIEHYGLLRQKLDDGRYEPCQPHHSWNTNHIVSNVLQIHLQRHSDHHANPMRPYQTLRNFPDLPRLPSGYPGCLVLSSIPPLWFAVMDPKVMAWADGDLSRVNIHEPARKRLERRWAHPTPTPVSTAINPALR
ncbi:alkane 1-monooxygenase [Parvularcula sp. LCG005]|uniref:alkane 1-monooxygenase n=1 Tax=Parvularcula sp. LCG005 TaxID=3078805 RepID=UPI002942D273|nr:alkane 1-monooxygenase [Parvularcula sp. LCG005]WOI53510.1 alkane 1-monooxygenase [Parvularcula sp. LCG005]